ncbi:MAG TPA: hypothetical protein PLR25_21815, partial [Planctomycetaceae bacterium]|nr:hypothetical protein [Planctomycetaceae bacterium]
MTELFRRFMSQPPRRRGHSRRADILAVHDLVETLEARVVLSADAYEDNDTKIIVDAQPEAGVNSPNLGLVSGIRQINNLNMDDSADWYRFKTSGVGTTDHSVQLSFDRTSGDVDLYVYRADGTTQVQASTHYSYNGDGGLETVSLSGELSGTFYAKIIAKAAGQPSLANYTLTINAPTTSGDDPYEDNDTKIIVDGKTVGATNSPNLGLLTGVTTINNLLLNDAADWYRFQTSGVASPDHSVQLSFDRTWGDIDLYVYRSDGATQVQSSTNYSYNGNGGLETVGLSGELSGVFYVKVVAKSTAANNPPGIANYSLTINAPTTSGDDPYEDNDTKIIVDGKTVGATNSPNLGLLTGVTTINNLLLNDAADWYRFQTSGVASPDHSVQLSFDRTWGDIDLYVYRSDGATQVQSSTNYSYNGNGGLETVGLSGELSGVFYVKVVAKSTAANNPPGIANYSLTINAPTTSGDDPYEDND